MNDMKYTMCCHDYVGEAPLSTLYMYPDLILYIIGWALNHRDWDQLFPTQPFIILPHVQR